MSPTLAMDIWPSRDAARLFEKGVAVNAFRFHQIVESAFERRISRSAVNKGKPSASVVAAMMGFAGRKSCVSQLHSNLVS